MAITTGVVKTRSRTGPQHGSGFYELRLESIGGLGAHLAGQILAEAGVLEMGLNGAHFSSYGSEKKGSPVRSYVRLGPAERPIRITSPVREPDLVAVFHAALLEEPGVTAGLRPGATLIVNTAESPVEVAERLGMPGVRVTTLDAIGIAVAEKSRVNTAMLGAIAKAAPILEPEAVRRVIARTLGQKYPQLLEANLRTFDRGHVEAGLYSLPAPADWAAAPGAKGAPVRTAPVAAPEAVTAEAVTAEAVTAGVVTAGAVTGGAGTAGTAGGPVVGYQTAPLGGVLPTPGNSVHKNLSASRQGFLPVLHQESCVNCSICDLVCPDYCFVWEPTGKVIAGMPAMALAGIDYQYCKGCMQCVTECPTGALTSEREIGDIAERLRVPVRFDRGLSGGIPAGRERLVASGWGNWATGQEEGS